MTDHLIWAAGLLGHLLLLGVLFARKRVHRFPWFTLLIVLYLLRSIALATALLPAALLTAALVAALVAASAIVDI